MRSIDQNKALVVRLYDETNRANAGVIDELFSADLVNHQAGGLARGGGLTAREQLKSVFELFYKAFPDTKHVIEDMIGEGDKVVARISATGTHTGEMLGAKPSGARVTMTGTVTYRFADGRIVERWADEDRLGFFQQLGLVRYSNDYR